jgi:methylthioribose-1-phosphate isomerase
MTRARVLLLFNKAPHCNSMEEGARLESCNAGALSVVEIGQVLRILDVGGKSEQFDIRIAVARESRQDRQSSSLSLWIGDVIEDKEVRSRSIESVGSF